MRFEGADPVAAAEAAASRELLRQLALPPLSFVAGCANGAVQLWRTGRSAAPVAVPSAGGGHKGPVRALLALQREGLAVSGGEDSTLRFWQLRGATAGACARKQAKAHGGAVTALAAVVRPAPAPTLLASGGEDGAIRLWSLRGGKPVELLAPSTLDTHGEGVDPHAGGVAALLSLAPPSPFLLVSGGVNGALRFWSPPPPAAGVPAPLAHALVARVHCHRAAITALAALREGRCASAAADGTVQLWGAGGQPERGLALTRCAPDGRAVPALALAPLRGGRLAVACGDRVLRVLPADAPRLGASDGAPAPATLVGHAAEVSCCASLARRRVLFSSGPDRTLLLWAQPPEDDAAPPVRCLVTRLPPEAPAVLLLAALPDNEPDDGG